MAFASEKSFPFDADEVGGNYDREYLAEDFARYFRAFISSGVFMKIATNLQVIANGDMSVTLKPGSVMIEGYRYDNLDDIVIILSPADGIMDRIDRISLTWSMEDRDIHCTVQEGVFSYEPTAPECRRNAEYKDYVVADIRIHAGVISILQENITDQRLNSEVCGMAFPFGDLDTSTINAKLQAYFDRVMQETDQWQESEKIAFTEWYNQTTEHMEEFIALLEQNSTEMHDIYMTDIQNLYRDIQTKSQQKYDAFNASIIAYIEELENRGETKLAAITQQLLDFRNTNEAAFLAFLEEMKDKLREYPLGKFQIQFDEMKAQQEEMLQMLMTGMVTTNLITDEGDCIVDDMGNAILVGWPICKCN